MGYLEEEAVHTYTKVLEAIDNGKLPLWATMKAPPEAIEYYSLNPETATMRDLILAVRADEAVHRSVNHHFSDIPNSTMSMPMRFTLLQAASQTLIKSN